MTTPLSDLSESRAPIAEADSDNSVVLGVDTATDVRAGVARDGVVVASDVVADRRAHAEQLLPLVQRVLTAAGVTRKIQILEAALEANADAKEPLQALAALGGFEVATLTGAVLQAAAERRVIVVDGFITTAAVLVASQLQPAVLERCVFAHCSGEPGHAHMLRILKGEALLDLGLRLGEGSGAALAWPLLQSACAILREMASFESAGVDGGTAA